jgi:predicted kinase
MEPVLIVMSGLPGTGKSTLARALAAADGAVQLRIDVIEQAIVRAGLATRPGPAGYSVGYALAEDLLRQGHPVIGDSVNPLPVTRKAWRAVALRAGVGCVEVEVICSDPAEHEARVTRRTSDIPDLRLPTWADVQAREYLPWGGDRIVVDTAGRDVAHCLSELRRRLEERI